MSTFKRAVYPAKQAQVEVVQANFEPLNKGEIRVKNTYASSNPIDWKVQKYGIFVNTFPFVFGSDYSGVVEAVGEGTRFKKGDRVFGWTPVYFNNKPSYGTFQEFTTTTADTTVLTPSHVTDEAAVTFCLPIITSMSGLYYSLGLERPPLTRDLIGTKNEYIWINAGSSAVGSIAVQMAVLSGFKVLTTASPKNFEFVKSLGATEVFDYNDPALVEKVKKFLNGEKIRYAYDADSRLTSVSQAVEILNKSGSLSLVLSKPSEIEYGDVKVDDNHTWRSFTNPEIYGWWFPWIEEALKNNLLKPTKIEVIGNGAESAQALLDYHASGKVSASKPVIKF